MSDIAASLAPIMPIITDAAITLASGFAILAVREGISILQHWFHIKITDSYASSLETAAANAAGAIVAKGAPGVMNEVFSVNDPRVRAAADWIVNQSVQHQDAVHDLAVDADDISHKIVSKIGVLQSQAPAVVAPATSDTMAK